jgi:regulator of sigma E protease
LLTLVSFLFALTVLIAVHEYGHYRMAVACKVPVLVFSIGFGKSVYRWRPKNPRPGQNTEFVLGALPLGGYIQMLDSREATVLPEQLPLAFDQRSLKVRAAIVAAGPLANLFLAVVLFSALSWWGQPQALPILASPLPGSWAAQAGLEGGERVQSIQMEGEDSEDIQSFQSLWRATSRAESEGSAMRWSIARDNSNKLFELEIPSPQQLKLLRSTAASQAQGQVDQNHWQDLGFRGPSARPLIGRIEPGSAAEVSGLQPGDVVLRVDGRVVADAQQLRDWIRAEPLDPLHSPLWEIDRHGRVLSLSVVPQLGTASSSGGLALAGPVRRIGAVVGAPPQTLWVSLGFVEGLQQGFGQVKQISLLTLNLIGKMLSGTASSKHLSGPLTIAEQAGQSAQMGFSAYVSFLALVSVSLGLLNLLPLPMLDGGHLMYYLWESLTGNPVSVAWQQGLQKVGLASLIFIMSLALFNDLSRLFN